MYPAHITMPLKGQNCESFFPCNIPFPSNHSSNYPSPPITPPPGWLTSMTLLSGSTIPVTSLLRPGRTYIES